MNKLIIKSIVITILISNIVVNGQNDRIQKRIGYALLKIKM